MELLKLVIVDDEPILLKGLLTTYDWKQMGFQVVGTAQSGEQAIQVIEETRPDAVLTDIRMKQMTGLDVMEQVRQTRKDCLFIVLSAYRDFDYAQKACDLGAFAYLLKPIEDDKLLETMSSAYESCMKQRRSAEKVANLEKVIQGDSDSFLQMVVQKYLQKEISAEKMQQVLEATGQMIGRDDRFVTLMAGVDLAYKITNALEYEASCFVLKKELQERIEGVYDCWNFVMQKDGIVFVIRTTENTTVHKLKQLLDQVREEQNSPVIGAISKPYKGLDGIRRSYEEAKQLLELAASSKAGILTTLELAGERAERSSSAEEEAVLLHAVRKNDAAAMKQAFIELIYALPEGEEAQVQKLHEVMLQAEMMIESSYGMTEELKKQFRNYYANMEHLNASRTVDVCYKILGGAIEARCTAAAEQESSGSKEYMREAIAYIEEHLAEEELSIVSVAAYIYLNPVYFGRVFKETMQMSFKKYLLQRRMERAKKILQTKTDSISSICEEIGINNPSYFSHLFKEYTGKLPSEYKKEFET